MVHHLVLVSARLAPRLVFFCPEVLLISKWQVSREVAFFFVILVFDPELSNSEPDSAKFDDVSFIHVETVVLL